MPVFPLLVIVHALAATVWTCGHLVLDLGLFPRALRAQSAAQVRAFEEVFEPLGLTALAIQVLTAWEWTGSISPASRGCSERPTRSACWWSFFVSADSGWPAPARSSGSAVRAPWFHSHHRQTELSVQLRYQTRST